MGHKVYFPMTGTGIPEIIGNSGIKLMIGLIEPGVEIPVIIFTGDLIDLCIKIGGRCSFEPQIGICK